MEERFVEAILEDMAWLGLSYKEIVRQSVRGDFYREAQERLKSCGRLYPCTETPEELALRARRLRAQNKPPVYRQGAPVDEHREPHWRFALSGDVVVFKDLVRGEVVVDTNSLSDPILVRSDGSFVYTLPSVVDDMVLGTTHVIRGQDHITNTAVHLELLQALGGAVPRFAHHPLVVDAQGRNLSKRGGAAGVRFWREQGVESMAVSSWLARHARRGATTLEELARDFKLSSLGRSPIRFDEGSLWKINARLLGAMDYDTVKKRAL